MTPERSAIIFDLLPTLVLSLPQRSADLGPAFLLELIGKCRANLNHVTLLLHEIQEERTGLESDLHGKEADFEMQHDTLLAEDPAIRLLPNIADREATVRVFLRVAKGAISTLKKTLQTLSGVEKAVKLAYTELKGTMQDIRRQQQLLHDDIKLKTFYGSEETPHPTGDVPPVNGEGGLFEQLERDLSDLDSSGV